MKIPTYYSFNEFVNNYENDFAKWLKVYPDGNENYFIDELLPNYYRFNDRLNDSDEDIHLSNYISVSINEKDDPYPLQKYIDFEFYLAIITNRLHQIISTKNLNPQTELEFFSLIKIDLFDDGDRWLENDFDDYQISHIDFELYKQFIKVEKDFLDLFTLSFDFLKFKNYNFAVNKIVKYLRNKITNISDQKLINENSKIKINGNTQLLGHIFIQLIEGGYIEPIRFGSGEINKISTARSILDHFDFTENETQPSEEYLKKAIFENEFSQNKIDYLLITPLNKFD